MTTLIEVVLLIAGYLVLTRWLLPRLGVPT